jgi:hypothetical protein
VCVSVCEGGRSVTMSEWFSEWCGWVYESECLSVSVMCEGVM